MSEGKLYVLLDLNYTLVANSEERGRGMADRIRRERYRGWLVALLASHHVMLVTGRPARHRAATLASIQDKTGWTPEEAYFNDRPALSLAGYKYTVLRDRIWPAHGRDRPYIAIESGSLVRAMWQSHGVPAIAAPLRGEQWDRLPVPPKLKKYLKTG